MQSSLSRAFNLNKEVKDRILFGVRMKHSLNLGYKSQIMGVQGKNS